MVRRADVEALSRDDLAALSNLGLLKRATKDLDEKRFTVQWTTEPDGTLQAQWSDPVRCVLPGGRTVREATCTCRPTSHELCRHVLRTILAWQAHQASLPQEDTSPVVQGPWDPGRMDEATVKQQVDKTVLTKATRLGAQGVLAELIRSHKPLAILHCPGHTVRFMVPDDLRYALCSCAHAPPCEHAVLAVRAFRLLAPDQPWGVVSSGRLDVPVPASVLDAAQGCVQDLVGEGLGGLSPAWRDRVLRVAADCTASQLAWPAQLLEELAEDLTRYEARDAAFSPSQTVERAGELLLRLDAIRAGCAPVPQAFIRGMKSDKDSELGSARLIGLGAAVTPLRHSTQLTVFLQSLDTGHVLTITQEHADTPDDPQPPPYSELGKAAAAGSTMAALAAGQLITNGGHRTASGRLKLGRGRAGLNPQTYQWEQLKAPTLVENFAELTARLRMLPPASFRPRREAADFHVCPLSGCGSAAFSAAHNAIIAEVHDRDHQPALLLHPWTSRGERGAEALLRALRRGDRPLFVAGHMRASSGPLVIRPTALVFKGEADSRRLLMPWLEEHQGGDAAPADTLRFEGLSRPQRYTSAAELASDLLLNGLRRTRTRQWPQWDSGITQTEARGYHRMAQALRKVKADEHAGAALNLLRMLALARDLA